MTDLYRQAAQKEWDQIRRKALWTQLKSYVTRRDIRLRDFEEISRQLQLRGPRYKGSQEIPLDKIVGSVGRYNDFVASFLPITAEMQERWQGVASAFLNPTGASVPPIEVYKVGGSYFVKDGNHRCSVARQLGIPTIDAYVWEYPLPEGMNERVDIDTIIIEHERLDFLNETNLDSLRPEHDIRVTVPYGYCDLLEEIWHYQAVLEQIDGEPKTLEEAVTAWYDMIYEPSVQIIEREGVLDHFPNRTPADLFIFTHRRQEELERQYGRSIRVTDAVRRVDLDRNNRLKRWMQQVKGWLPFTS